MFDTHCHLNFKTFDGKVSEVVERAKKAGIRHIIIPGTDIQTSKKAVELTTQFDNVYAAVGIHPHHIYSYNVERKTWNVKKELAEVEKLLTHPKVVAVGEVGIDRHYYDKTKYTEYRIDETFINQQKVFLRLQIDLALQYKKSLILHNREAKKDTLSILREVWDKSIEGRSVFHCCEPDGELLDFAKQHNMCIGVDGDITYRKDKQEFIKKVPLEMLVLETDSPFLHPEPLRSQPRATRGPNEPKNLKLIAEFIAKILHISLKELAEVTEENSKRLFAVT
ncbi:TatD family hydrolase [Candidatus Roizmanbacteria bacterium]|nr:TatD family hydrolase [Candidatus Roizmanbacteria bacterium]